MNNPLELSRFVRRVRLLFAWRGLAFGGTVGGLACVGWATLDWLRIDYARWIQLGILFGACAIIGSIIGIFFPVPKERLARSIDRRAGLEDRLCTWMERDGTGTFDSAISEDASTRLKTLKPAKVFPLRVSRLHLTAVVAGLLASAIFLLGNTPLLLSDQQKKDRDELKRAGQTVERVTKDFEKEVEKKPATEDEKQLAQELKQFRKELDRARMDKQEAMQKANELAKKAEQLTQQHAEASQQHLEEAQKAQEKMLDAKSQSAEMQPLQQQLSQLQQQAAEMQKQSDALQQRLGNPNLTQSERAALQKQKSDLDKKLGENKNLQLQLSQKVKDMLNRMMNNPIYKELEELAKKLAENSKPGVQGQPPPLTKEQLEEMQKELDELADKLKDDKAMQEYLEALKKALEDAKKMGASQGVGIGLFGALGMPTSDQLTSDQPGAPSVDIYHGDSGKINKRAKPTPGEGKTTPIGVTGDRQDKGDETYIETRGPASLGNRSKIPYQQVLPSYKRKAEQAINRQKIPPDQAKRVKQYFESLQGGG